MWPFRKLFHFCHITTLLVSGLGLSQNTTIDISIQQGHVDDIERIQISPNRHFFATTGKDNRLVVWDYNSGKQVTYVQFPKPIATFAFSNTDDSIFYSLENIPVIKALVISDTSIVNRPKLALSKSNKNQVFFENKQVSINWATLILVDAQTGRKIAEAHADFFEKPFTAICYSNRSQKIYAACRDGSIYIFSNRLVYEKQLRGHLGIVTDLAVSSDNHYLFSVSTDRSIIRWSIDAETMVARYSGTNLPLSGIDIHESQKELIYGDESGNLGTLFWDQKGIHLNAKNIMEGAIINTDYSSDGKLIASGIDNYLFAIPPLGETKNSESNTEKAIRKKISKNIVSYIDLKNPDKTFSPMGILDAGFSADKSVYYITHSEPDFKNSYIQFLHLKSGHFRSSQKVWPIVPSFRYFTGKKTDGVITKFPLHSMKNTVINDSTFVSSVTIEAMIRPVYGAPVKDTTSLYFWRINDGNVRKISFMTRPMPYKMNNLNALNDSALMYIYNDSLYAYQVNTNIHVNTGNHALGIQPIQGKGLLIENKDHSFRVYGKDKNWSNVFRGHLGSIRGAAFLAKHNQLITSSDDGTLRFWNYSNGSLIATLIPAGIHQFVILTPDNYYYLSSKKVNSFGFKKGIEYFLPEQFDAFYNRPDIVLSRLGFMDSTTINLYRDAYHKRIQKLGFTEDMLKPDFHLPKAFILNADSMSYLAKQNIVNLYIKCTDEKYLLDRVNVWINDVPIFGSKGINIKDKSIHDWEDSLSINLASGVNKIQVSVHNQVGVESFRDDVYIKYEPALDSKPDLYLITLGVSSYKDKTFDLRFAAKDAQDIAAYFGNNQGRMYDSIHISTLTDEQVTRENVLKIKQVVQKATRDDVVIISFAGHGVLSSDLDYFLATHDMDFSNPQLKGLAYEELEGLVDGIQPLKKVLFIDACHSGELDKESIASTQVAKGVVAKPVGRGVVLGIEQEPYQAQTGNLVRELFSDLRRGTGATIISASGGMEFAMESQDWQNGLFTYCLLNGLEKASADKNKDGQIYLAELQRYLQNKVKELSGGKQQPTSRSENLSSDFRLK
jgi:WD40 repeat protein/uncharacterized caspase-like protein